MSTMSFLPPAASKLPSSSPILPITETSTPIDYITCNFESVTPPRSPYNTHDETDTPPVIFKPAPTLSTGAAPSRKSQKLRRKRRRGIFTESSEETAENRPEPQQSCALSADFEAAPFNSISTMTSASVQAPPTPVGPQDLLSQVRRRREEKKAGSKPGPKKGVKADKKPPQQQFAPPGLPADLQWHSTQVLETTDFFSGYGGPQDNGEISLELNSSSAPVPPTGLVYGVSPCGMDLFDVAPVGDFCEPIYFESAY